MLAFSLFELFFEPQVFLANANEVDIIAEEVRGAIEDCRFDGLYRAQQFHEHDAPLGGPGLGLEAGRQQMQTEQQKRAGGQHHAVAPQKRSPHLMCPERWSVLHVVSAPAPAGSLTRRSRRAAAIVRRALCPRPSPRR